MNKTQFRKTYKILLKIGNEPWYEWPNKTATKRDWKMGNTPANGFPGSVRFIPTGEKREIMVYERVKRFAPKTGAKFSVNTYERSQQYGGAEEGGWWYHNEICTENRQFKSLRKAKAYLAKLRKKTEPFTETILCSKREKLSEWGTGFSLLDGYGQGKIVNIENHPLPARENLSRPRYE